jgi:prefoldin subunit 5
MLNRLRRIVWLIREAWQGFPRIRQALDEIERTIEQVEQMLARLDARLSRIEDTLDRLQGLVGGADPPDKPSRLH